MAAIRINFFVTGKDNQSWMQWIEWWKKENYFCVFLKLSRVNSKALIIKQLKYTALEIWQDFRKLSYISRRWCVRTNRKYFYYCLMKAGPSDRCNLAGIIDEWREREQRWNLVQIQVWHLCVNTPQDSPMFTNNI